MTNSREASSSCQRAAWLLPATPLSPCCAGLETELLHGPFRRNLEITIPGDWTNEKSSMNFLIEDQGLSSGFPPCPLLFSDTAKLAKVLPQITFLCFPLRVAQRSSSRWKQIAGRQDPLWKISYKVTNTFCRGLFWSCSLEVPKAISLYSLFLSFFFFFFPPIY